MPRIWPPFCMKVYITSFSKNENQEANTIVVRDWSLKRESQPLCSLELGTNLQFDLQIMLAWTWDCHISCLKESLGWHLISIQTLPKAFIFFECVFDEFTCVTIKMSKSNDNHIPNCMFDNKRLFLSHMPPPFSSRNTRSIPFKALHYSFDHNGRDVEICFKKWTISMNHENQYSNKQILNDSALELSHHFWKPNCKEKSQLIDNIFCYYVRYWELRIMT